MRSVERRLRELERPRSLVLGQWVIGPGLYGDLVADHLPTGRRFKLTELDPTTTGEV